MNIQWKTENSQNTERATECERKFNVSDAASEYTRRLKRNLYSWAALLFLAKYYHIQISKIPWIEVSVPNDRADALGVVVAIPLLYPAATFAFQAHADLSAWQTKFEETIAKIAWGSIHRLQSHWFIVQQFIEGKIPATPQNPPMSETKLLELLNNSMEAVDSTTQQISRMLSHAAAATRTRRFFAYGWEYWLPLVFAFLSLLYARSELIAGVVAIFESLLN